MQRKLGNESSQDQTTSVTNLKSEKAVNSSEHTHEATVSVLFIPSSEKLSSNARRRYENQVSNAFNINYLFFLSFNLFLDSITT